MCSSILPTRFTSVRQQDLGRSPIRYPFSASTTASIAASITSSSTAGSSSAAGLAAPWQSLPVASLVSRPFSGYPCLRVISVPFPILSAGSFFSPGTSRSLSVLAEFSAHNHPVFGKMSSPWRRRQPGEPPCWSKGERKDLQSPERRTEGFCSPFPPWPPHPMRRRAPGQFSSRSARSSSERAESDHRRRPAAA